MRVYPAPDGGHSNDSPVYGISPGQIDLVEIPKRVRWVGVREGEPMPTREEVDQFFDDIDPESKALRAICAGDGE